MDCLHAVLFGSLLIIVFSAVQGDPVCEWGKYGHICDRLCSDHCGLHPGRNLRPCNKDTGKCLQGCVRGRHGDHCDQLCSRNCINTICNQGNGGCTIGCIDGYSGYFCNITTVSAVHGVPVCEWGKYGHNCDRLCSDHCGLYPVRNLRPCHKDSGKCLQGCVRGRHGDHCDQLCSQNCISAICNQGNGGCTIGCIDGYIGYFCNITTGTQIQTTVTATYRPCDWGRFGETCDQACPPGCALGSNRNTNYCQTVTGTCTRGCRRGWHGDRCEKLCGGNCIVDICHQGSGHCTHGCRGRYTGEFCESETGEGHITQSIQWMWMLSVAVFIFSTMCCWKSPRCRRRFDKGFTWLIRRNPSASSRDPSQDLCRSERVPLVPLTTQDSDQPASSDPSQDPSQNERDPRLSKASRDEALYFATRDGDLEKVKRLLSTAGVDVNCCVGAWDRTPVMMAASMGHRKVVELLVSQGAELSMVDMVGNNFFHIACMGGDVEMVKFLLSLNVVDIAARNNSGETAANVARDWERQRVVDLLESRGAQ